MDRLANTITDYYIRKKIITEEKREIYSYGFKLIIADVINYVIIISLGIVFNRLIESTSFLVALCGLRQFSGGFHAKTFWLCRLSMIITYICVMLLTDIVTYTKYETIIVISVNVISIVIIAITAPIVHLNKPLSDKQKYNNKIKSVITSIFMSIVSIIIIVATDMKFGVTISITLLAVVVLMIIGMAVRKGGKENV